MVVTYRAEEVLNNNWRHGRRPVGRRQNQAIISASGLRFGNVSEGLPNARGTTAHNKLDMRVTHSVERGAGPGDNSLSLVVVKVRCLAVAALQYEASDTSLGHAEEVRLYGGKVDGFVFVKEGD